MSRRRRGKRDTENEDRWLITYSDLITLLMIFFVIMYAMSKVDVAKFMVLSQSLSAALHSDNQIPLKDLGKTGLVLPTNPMDQGHNNDNTGTMTKPKPDQALDNLYAEVKAYIQQHNLSDNVKIDNQVRGVQITLRDVVLFDTGQAVIKPEARTILTGLSPFLDKLNNPVVIEGYTDDRPINTPQFPSNWELSAARAINVVRFFTTQKIDPARLSAVGYGQYHPVVPNDSEANRQENRRINIVILRKTSLQNINSTTP